LKPERWGSPLVQEKYQKEKTCDKRHPYSSSSSSSNNNNGKGHPKTCREGTGSVIKLYSFFNLGAKWEWVINATSRPLYPPGKRPCADCIGGWVGPMDGLDTYGPSKCREANTQTHGATTQNTFYLNTKTSLHLIKSFGALISSG
jgi:hypothetical protein